MNALEIADAMEKYSVAGFQYPLCEEFNKAATMLRQQQAEIEALKDEVAEWKMSYENCHRMCGGYGMN